MGITVTVINAILLVLRMGLVALEDVEDVAEVLDRIQSLVTPAFDAVADATEYVGSVEIPFTDTTVSQALEDAYEGSAELMDSLWPWGDDEEPDDSATVAADTEQDLPEMNGEPTQSRQRTLATVVGLAAGAKLMLLERESEEGTDAQHGK